MGLSIDLSKSVLNPSHRLWQRGKDNGAAHESAVDGVVILT